MKRQLLNVVALLLLAQLLVPAALLPHRALAASPLPPTLSSAPPAPLEGPAPPPPGQPPTIPLVPGKPVLRLQWAATNAQVGVPIGLTIQALDAAGRSDAGLSGTVLLLIRDDRATIAGVAAKPVTGGEQAAVPLHSGSASLAVTFWTPGRSGAEALLQGQPAFAGADDHLLVQATTLALDGPATVEQGAKVRFTVSARNEQGQTVDGYTGPLALDTADITALVTDPGDAQPAQARQLGRRLTAADHGAMNLDVTFVRAGVHLLTAYDPAAPYRRVSLTVTVLAKPAPTTTSPCSGASRPVAGCRTPTATTTAVVCATAPAKASRSATPAAASTQTCPSATTHTAATPGATAATTLPRVQAGLHHGGLLYLAGPRNLGLIFGSSVGSFQVTFTPSSANAGVPLTMTVTALDANGVRNTSYQGVVSYSSSDGTAVVPGGHFCLDGSGRFYNWCYTFTSADAGQHNFPVTFNSAGSQTVTFFDINATTMTGTSVALIVAETYLSASFGASTVTQGTAVSLTVQAKDGSGALVAGYTGTVGFAASAWSVQSWGPGVNSSNTYTFTAGDAGSHTFTVTFRSAGTETATVTDQANSSRTGTSGAIAVTNTPAASYWHHATPNGVQLADGTTVWAFTGIYGELYVRRNVGSATLPVWAPLVLVRGALNTPNGYIGADTPSLAVLGNTLALFHTYSDGTYFQVWVTTSSDEGATWSAPVQLTQESGHVARVQTVTVGGRVYLFWSRQDTDGKLYYETSSDAVNWSAKTTVGQSVGPLVSHTSSYFGILHMASGSWLLGWLYPSPNNQYGAGNTPDYPTIHMATSGDLSAWSAAQEITQPYSQHWPLGVAFSQANGTINALFEAQDGWDQYILLKTSPDGATWSPALTTNPPAVIYDHGIESDGTSGPNGWQGFESYLPALLPGTSVAAASMWTCGGRISPCYGQLDGSKTTSIEGLGIVDVSAPGQPLMVPFGSEAAQRQACPTGRCARVGPPIDAVTGAESTSATDLAVAARGMPLRVSRAYRSMDGAAGLSGAFGYGWSWLYGVHARVLTDGSVAIVEATGRQAVFWKQGSGWTQAADVNATLAAGTGGGYTLTRHDQSVWTFDSGGKLLSIADANGNTQTLAYTNGQLSGITGAGGRALTITTDGTGRITAIAGPGGLAASYTYDGSGNLATATDAAGAKTTYTYDGQHQLLTVVDGNGHTVETNTYGGGGRVIQQLDTMGKATLFGYGLPSAAGSGGNTAITDALGNETDYWYDADLRLTERDAHQGNGSGPLLQKVQWTYDSNNNVTSLTDGDGVMSAFTYDASANVLTKTVDLGGLNLKWTYTYDSLNDTLTSTDPNNHTTTDTYDGHGNRLTSTDALSHTTSYAYDGMGELTNTTDADNQTTTFGYSAAGDLTTITTPDNAVTTLGYDAAGRVTSVTDPLTHTTTFAYDGMGRQTSVTNALGQTTATTYDAVGDRTKVTDALNRATSYVYDAKNRLTAITDALGQATTNAYDVVDNVVSVTDANSHATTYGYDALHRRTSAKDALGDTTTTGFDLNGNQTSVTDAKNHTTSYGYDHADRLLTVTDALGGKTADAYDGAGNRTSVTDANGHTQTFAYDATNRLISATDALNHTTAYAYDAAGNLTQTTLPTGTVNRQGYDNRNRLIGIDPGNTGSFSITYAYDTANRRTSMTDATGTTTYAYDNANRLTSVTAPATPPLTTTLGMAYDAAGERTSLTYPSGQQVTYAYTARGQLESVTDWLSNQTRYTYDNAGRLTAITSPNGVTGSLGYDSADRLTSVAYLQGTTSLESISYTRDAVGNPTVMTDSTGSTSYGYDALDRLTSATYPNADAVSYAYDPVGNRIGLTVNGVTTTSTFDNADRLTASGSTTYSYDATGNELTKTAGGVTTSYTYDPLNRLTGLSGPTTASYSSNGDGLRVGKTVNGVTTTYTWDPTGPGHVVADGSGDAYLWGQGLVGQVTGAVASYAHADGLGSVRLVTGAAGVVLGRQSYDAYSASRSSSGTQLPFGFTGEQTDAESGLVYLRARYMDPSTGRFLTRDSFGGAAGDPQSLNRYAYAEGDPTANTDPSGRCIGPLLAACIAWGVADAAPVLLGMGAAIVSSPVLVAMIGEQIQGAQQDVDTLLCPSASSMDRLGAAANLALAALALIPEGDAYAASAADAARLQKSLASAQQMSEAGRVIIGAGTRKVLYDGPRLAATYGGQPEDWAKMVSTSYTAVDGTRFETHWYENVVTGERVEFKTKFQ